MNRCTLSTPCPTAKRRLLCLALALPLFSLGSAAVAQTTVRPFPPTAQRGVMKVIAPPVVNLNGRPERLSPGSRIRGVNNMLIMSGALIGENLLVNFVRNPMGEVHEVWILTEAEAALKLPAQP